MPRIKARKLGISRNGLVLDLPLYKLDGASFMSKDAYGHLATVTGATFGIKGRTFVSASNNYIAITDVSSILNFTSGDFSIVIRCQPSNAGGGDQYFFTRGLVNTDGYSFMMTSGGRLNFYTWQATAEQRTFTAATSFVNGTNYTIGISRSGTSAILYKNGVNVNDTSASHTNPLTSTRTARIGVNDGLTGGWGALVASVFVYNRSLSAAEQLSMHNKLAENPL